MPQRYKICAYGTHNTISFIMENKKKTKFRQFYDALPPKAEIAPKTAFVKKIAAMCKVHEVTVRCWIAGTQKPDALKTSIIAQELGIPEQELFT